MAKSTFLQLVQKTKEECGVSGGTVGSVLNQSGRYADLVRWVADAAYEIETMHGDWDFLWTQWTQSTIASTAVYTAPTDFGTWDCESFVLDPTTVNHRELHEKDYRELRKARRGVQTDNKPSVFSILPSKSVQLYPTPDGVYTLEAYYWRKPVRMTGNDDTSAIPEEFERTIIARAKMKYAEDQGAPVMLSNTEVEYSEWLDKLERSQLPSKHRSRLSEPDALVVVPQ